MENIDELNKRAVPRAKTSARRARHQRDLGEHAVCPFCFYANPAGLISSKDSKDSKVVNLLENHHPVGRNNDAELVFAMCRNCHAEITEGYRAEGVEMCEQTSLVELLIASLTALAVFFRVLADMFLRWVERIRRENLVAAPRRVGA